jgi:hypothetical protein
VAGRMERVWVLVLFNKITFEIKTFVMAEQLIDKYNLP